jgi:hypothetical protein
MVSTIGLGKNAARDGHSDDDFIAGLTDLFQAYIRLENDLYIRSSAAPLGPNSDIGSMVACAVLLNYRARYTSRPIGSCGNPRS